MQRLVCRSGTKTILIVQRAQLHEFNRSTSHRMRMALPFTVDESQALKSFDKWRKSLWLAPSDWQNTSVTVTPRYLPCWSFDLQGSVSAEAYVKRGSWLFGGTEWHPLTDRVKLKNVQLSDINVYAAHDYDRQHILDLDMKIDKNALKSLDSDSSTTKEEMIEEYTVDRDTAFEIGWDLTIVKIIQDLCVQQLNSQKRDNYRITSVRYPIDKETQELIYFPIYVVNFPYGNRQLQYLINGRTGKVVGLRQFSRLKITALLLAVVYPICAGSLVSVLSSAYYTFTGRNVLIPCALIVTGMSLPFTAMAASQVGKYIRDYAHLYRGTRDIREWLDFKKRNPYIFTAQPQDEREDSTTFSRERTEETRKSTFTLNVGPDLYGVLGISRLASDATIKQAYFAKAKEFHPDRHIGNSEMEEKFKLINQAYAILSNREQRELFDQYGYDHVKYK